MNYNYDELLDITEEYLNTLDLSEFLPDEGIEDMDDVAQRLKSACEAGKFPPMPEALEGNIFKAFDTWDLTVYLKNRYNLVLQIDTIYKYWISKKK